MQIVIKVLSRIQVHEHLNIVRVVSGGGGNHWEVLIIGR